MSKISDRFEYLLLKKLNHQLSEAEKYELEELLSHNRDLRNNYRLFQAYWNNKAVPNHRDRQLFNLVLQRIESEGNQFKHPSRIRKYLPYAAACLLLFSISYAYLFFQADNYHKLTTRQNLETILLSDGTEVAVNAGSTFIYPKTFEGEGQREVRLQGEAFFKVKSNARQPFIVKTDYAEVRALGTTFNVRAYPKEKKTSTSLIEGLVEVVYEKDKENKIRLEPQDKFIVGTSEKPLIGKGNLDTVLSRINYYHPQDSVALEALWTKHRLAVKDTPFSELADELERRYAVKIIFKGKEAQQLRFSAVFEKESIQQILEILKMAAPFHFVQDNDKIIINDQTS